MRAVRAVRCWRRSMRNYFTKSLERRPGVGSLAASKQMPHASLSCKFGGTHVEHRGQGLCDQRSDADATVAQLDSERDLHDRARDALATLRPARAETDPFRPLGHHPP